MATGNKKDLTYDPTFFLYGKNSGGKVFYFYPDLFVSNRRGPFVREPSFVAEYSDVFILFIKHTEFAYATFGDNKIRLGGCHE
jgi:hypothetical protein